MTIRKYRPDDCAEMARLFYETVHSVNTKDYTEEQVNAWADGNVDTARWNSSFLAHTSLVAVEDGMIVGFGDMAEDGYLDRLYVHKDHQRRGVAAAICDELEGTVDAPVFSTHASITARPFFESRGYSVIKEQRVERHGVYMTNFVMEKCRRGE